MAHGINCYFAMAAKSKAKKNSTKKALKPGASPNGRPRSKTQPVQVNEYGIPDWRLERPEFEVHEVARGAEVHYEIRGKLNTPVPPIRESRYLTPQQHVELYRWMIMN
ncbi:MAG TPA: hypothetical protein VFL42_14450, partial [Terriglobales bacterium]|nr:hypothetical protein [Terriglobales bacterium]